MLEKRLFYCALFLLIAMLALATVMLIRGGSRFDTGSQPRSYVAEGRLL